MAHELSSSKDMAYVGSTPPFYAQRCLFNLTLNKELVYQRKAPLMDSSLTVTPPKRKAY